MLRIGSEFKSFIYVELYEELTKNSNRSFRVFISRGC